MTLRYNTMFGQVKMNNKTKKCPKIDETGGQNIVVIIIKRLY